MVTKNKIKNEAKLKSKNAKDKVKPVKISEKIKQKNKENWI